MFTEGSVESSRIVYTPSTFAKESLLYLQETGKLTALKQHTSTRSKLSSYLFFIVLSGSGRLVYEKMEYPLAAGDCVFIDCMKPYSHETSNDLWKLQWVHFNGSNMGGVYEKYSKRGGQPVFRPAVLPGYTGLLDLIFTIASTDDYLRDMKIYEKLAGLLTKIMEISWVPEKQVKLPRGSTREYSLLDVKNWIDDNWQKKIVLDDLAEMFYINKFYLTRLFKRQYGRSVVSYVLDLRITAAKKMLRFSGESVETIGRKCGFEDVNYFSRSFKKIEGISPMEYRRSWKQ